MQKFNRFPGVAYLTPGIIGALIAGIRTNGNASVSFGGIFATVATEPEPPAANFSLHLDDFGDPADLKTPAFLDCLPDTIRARKINAPYAADHVALFLLIYHYNECGRSEKRPRYFVRHIIDRLHEIGFMNGKRACYILETFANRNLYEYGVNLELGWLTPEGVARAREIVAEYAAG